MNSKQTLRRLLLGLAVAALGVTSCGEQEQKESNTQSQQSSSSIEESSSKQESSSQEQSSSQDTSSESSSSVEESSSSVEPTPEATVYDAFTFNYANKNMTVWTNEEIDQSVAPTARGNSGEDVSDYHTVGNTFEEFGYYTFAIDAQGFIEYASYGLGMGWGSPCDGYYHNQTSKDRTQAEYFVLNTEYADWPTKTTGGQDAWTLYDFVIPDGGFVITGFHSNNDFGEFWSQLFGESSSPKLSNGDTWGDNSKLELNTAPKSLDKFYVSLNENKQIEVRERLESEMKDSDGQLAKETTAINYTTTAADKVVAYNTIEDVLLEFAEAELDKTSEFIVKGVITSFYEDGKLIIEDEEGDAILVFNSDKSVLGTVAEPKFQVGQTISACGKLDSFNGLYELCVTDADDVKVINGYGLVEMPEPTIVNATNVNEVVTAANQGKYIKVVKAEVVSINETGSSKVKLGDTEISVYKADFPDNVVKGDFVDIIATVSAYKTNAQLRVDSAAAFARYYTIKTEINGVETTEGYANGDTVSLTATAKEGYAFSKWVKVVGETETDIGTLTSIDVTVDGDATYKAVYKVAPWSQLSYEYANVANLSVDKVNVDCGADTYSVITQADAKFHTDGDWAKGLFNTSWRGLVIVDGNGNIAYAVVNPANGYGGPMGSSYMTTYSDYTQNPAINILEGYGPWSEEAPAASKLFELKVPEGGFVIASHGAGSDTIINALLGATSWGKEYNKNTVDVSNIKVYFDDTDSKIRVYKDIVTEDTYEVTIDNSGVKTYGAGTVLHTSEGWTYGEWSNYMIVDQAGIIAYNVWNAGCGYGGAQASAYSNEKYATENPCFVDGNVVVPEGFTAIRFDYSVVNNVYSKLTGTQVTHSILDENGYSALAHAWNSPANPFILKNARIYVLDGKVAINNGGLQDKVTVNAKSLAEANTIFTGAEEETVALGDVTVALDQFGRVIFASYTHDGYGGPADGFYHDGFYKCAAGTTSGIFAIAEDFQPWAAGLEGSPWTKYSVVVPTNGKIITGSVDTMLPLVNKIFGSDLTAMANNAYLEGLADASYNHVVVNLAKDDVELVTKYVDVKGVTFIDSAEDLAAANLDDVYLVGVNAKGKVIYASHYGGAGYGGPADGFYHDGTYLCEAGKVCGIFNVDSQFAPWPATVKVGEETVNAWGLYSVVVPEGGYLIAGSAADMLPVINSIFGLTETALPENNALLEGMADGTVNGNKYVAYESIAQVGYSCGFTGLDGLAWNDVTGKWEGTCHLAKWTNYSLEYVAEAEQTATKIWYNNTTITGDIVANGTTIGDQWTGGLFIDSQGNADACQWMNSNDGGKDYFVAYDPAANTLTVTKA